MEQMHVEQDFHQRCDVQFGLSHVGVEMLLLDLPCAIAFHNLCVDQFGGVVQDGSQNGEHVGLVRIVLGLQSCHILIIET